MAFEQILEFDKNNRYKVKFEVGNIDTSTVGDVELDEEIANLQPEGEGVYSFSVRELYSAEGEHEFEKWRDDYRGGGFNGGGFDLERVESWSCDYSVDRYWTVALVDGELSVKNEGDYGEKATVDTYIQEINVKVKNILPSLMERILNVAKVEENKEWIIKKLELAKELEQAVVNYLVAKRKMRNELQTDKLQKLKVDTAVIELLSIDTLATGSLRTGVESLTTILGDLKVGKSSFSMLQVEEISFEEALKMESGTCSIVLNEIRSNLEKLLSEHSDNERMAQDIEEALALTKQPKVITAEEEMVSAWNKYIGLKMEGKE